MPVQKDSIGTQIKRLQRMKPKRDIATGLMYANAGETRRKTNAITLYGLFASDEGTFLLRPHVFKSEKTRDAKQWESWLADKYGSILRNNILPGMDERTGKQWRLYRIIGWVHDDNTQLANSPTRKPRNKTKPQRRKNGRNSTRSR